MGTAAPAAVPRERRSGTGTTAGQTYWVRVLVRVRVGTRVGTRVGRPESAGRADRRIAGGLERARERLSRTRTRAHRLRRTRVGERRRERGRRVALERPIRGRRS